MIRAVTEFAAALALAACSTTAPSAGTPAAPAAPTEVIWLGQSAFRSYP